MYVLSSSVHIGWDHHGGLPNGIKSQCRDTDQPTAALITDLKQRGLLDDTLVVWGGEFGRTIYSQGEITKTNLGETITRAVSPPSGRRGGSKGPTFGATDDWLQHRRRPRACSRSQCHDHASARHPP